MLWLIRGIVLAALVRATAKGFLHPVLAIGIFILAIDLLGKRRILNGLGTVLRQTADNVQEYAPQEMGEQSRQEQEIESAVAGVRKELKAGVPLESLARDLLASGFDKEAGAKFILIATKGRTKTCTNCDLSYISTVTFCTTCGTRLLEAERFTENR